MSAEALLAATALYLFVVPGLAAALAAWVARDWKWAALAFLAGIVIALGTPFVAQRYSAAAFSPALGIGIAGAVLVPALLWRPELRARARILIAVPLTFLAIVASLSLA